MANRENDICKIETDMITLSKDKEELVTKYIYPVLRESELYIAGNRAQQQLFEEDDSMDDADAFEDYSSITQATAPAHS